MVEVGVVVREIRGVRWRNEYKIIECACNNQRKYTPRGLISPRERKEGRKDGEKEGKYIKKRGKVAGERESPFARVPGAPFLLPYVFLCPSSAFDLFAYMKLALNQPRALTRYMPHVQCV